MVFGGKIGSGKLCVRIWTGERDIETSRHRWHVPTYTKMVEARILLLN